jgi:hypothetical protein
MAESGASVARRAEAATPGFNPLQLTRRRQVDPLRTIPNARDSDCMVMLWATIRRCRCTYGR